MGEVGCPSSVRWLAFACFGVLVACLNPLPEEYPSENDSAPAPEGTSGTQSDDGLDPGATSRAAEPPAAPGDDEALDPDSADRSRPSVTGADTDAGPDAGAGTDAGAVDAGEPAIEQ
jgi:hypothetical protein